MLALVPAGEQAALGAGAGNVHGSRREGDGDGVLGIDKTQTRRKRKNDEALETPVCSSNVER